MPPSGNKWIAPGRSRRYEPSASGSATTGPRSRSQSGSISPRLRRWDRRREYERPPGGHIHTRFWRWQTEPAGQPSLLQATGARWRYGWRPHSPDRPADGARDSVGGTVAEWNDSGLCGPGPPRWGDAGPCDTNHEVARPGSGDSGTDPLPAAGQGPQ